MEEELGIWAVTREPVILDRPVQIWRAEEVVADMVDDIERHYPNLGWIYFFAAKEDILG